MDILISFIFKQESMIVSTVAGDGFVLTKLQALFLLRYCEKCNFRGIPIKHRTGQTFDSRK